MTKSVDAVVELAMDLCRIPSPLGEEGPVGRFLASELEHLGFDVELQEVVSNRYNVVAISRGNPRYRSIVLNGHLDAPAPVGTWRQDPYDPWIENDTVYGAGIQDMKGGVAALAMGACLFVQNAPRDRGDVVLSFVMHHDTTGLGTKYFLETCPWRLDAGINAEPTNLQIQLFHGGAWCFRLETTGLLRHQSRLEEGVSAIAGMMQLIGAVGRDKLSYIPDDDHPELPRITVGIVSGGERAAYTAERCIAYGDVRYLPTMTIDGLREDLRRIADEVCKGIPGLKATVHTWRGQWPYQAKVSDEIVDRLAVAHQDVTGQAAVFNTGLPMSAAITDAADMQRHGIATVLYGPADWRTEPNEGIPIRDLVTAAEVYSKTCRSITTITR